MVYKSGNKHCIDCTYANTILNCDLDTLEIQYEPKYDTPNCHYCKYCYDNNVENR